MFEAAFSGLLALLTFKILAPLIIGLIVGLIIGVLPGLGGIVTLSLLVPFVYGMDPAPAFAMLMGSRVGVDYGGAITSILVNVPGNSTNVATCWDGYALAVKGEAGRALSAAAVSSFLGGVFGMVVLIALIPIVRPLVLAFGPGEYFMMTMLGLSLIVMVGRKSLIKGLFAGFLGILFSFVGLDPTTSIPRYTFGLLELWDGIAFGSLAIGVYGIGEMIKLIVEDSPALELQEVDARKSAMAGVKDTFRHWWLLIKSSAIGTAVGIAPGVGGAVAQFVAYGIAVHSSKTPEAFGKGMIEGVIAPEATNNAKEGGALLTTMAFGIPGSAAMAVLLGAFLILGLEPGPEMLTKNLDIVFSMIWVYLGCGALIAVIGILIAPYLALFVKLRGALVAGIVIPLCLIGAFAENNNLVDVWVAIAFGLLGYAMVKNGFPRETFIIGFILGKIAEGNFLLAYKLFGPAFLLRPITLVMLILTIALLVYAILPATRKQERRTSP